jgi:hypothetical protein
MTKACEQDERLSARVRERREAAASPESLRALEELRKLKVEDLLEKAGIPRAQP